MVKSRIKKYLIWQSFLFALSFALGCVFFAYFPQKTFLILDSVKGKFEFAGELGSLELFFFIFLNNAVISFFIIIFGVIFGIVPLFVMFTNGFLVGMVVAAAYRVMGPLKVAALILPHGIFELPAVIYSASLGLWLGAGMVKLIVKNENLGDKFKFAMLQYAKFIVWMILLAALIESTLTNFLKEYL